MSKFFMIYIHILFLAKQDSVRFVFQFEYSGFPMKKKSWLFLVEFSDIPLCWWLSLCWYKMISEDGKYVIRLSGEWWIWVWLNISIWATLQLCVGLAGHLGPAIYRNWCSASSFYSSREREERNDVTGRESSYSQTRPFCKDFIHSSSDLFLPL